jgi:hypothetical protein
MLNVAVVRGENQTFQAVTDTEYYGYTRAAFI